VDNVALSWEHVAVGVALGWEYVAGQEATIVAPLGDGSAKADWELAVLAPRLKLQHQRFNLG
jgi:hypothetical protein